MQDGEVQNAARSIWKVSDCDQRLGAALAHHPGEQDPGKTQCQERDIRIDLQFVGENGAYRF
jgi:hypothetical protein